MNKFTHLHTHSEFSLRDGLSRIDNMPKRAAELGMSHLSLTDHGTLAGVKQFVDSCKTHNIIPIIGSEMYMAISGNMGLRAKSDINQSGSFHFLVNAINETGYRNLVKLSSKAYTDGMYYKPRIDLTTLAEHHEGLVCTSACIGGGLFVLNEHQGKSAATTWAEECKEILGDRFFLEVQNNGLDKQTELNNLVLKLSAELDIPIVGTNDSHYVMPEDWKLKHTLECIGHRKTIANPSYPAQNLEAYLKSPDEMHGALKHLTEDAITNTMHIANMVDPDYFSKIRVGMPKFPGITKPASEILHKMAAWGLWERFNKHNLSVPQKYKDQLKHELKVIKDMGYSDYFLIIWDIINNANSCGIQVGPGRGSGAGSLVCWALNITKPDPIDAGLFFERFLNPARVSMPDLDIDFDPKRLSEVYDYIQGKYGTEHVSRIGSYGRFFGKGALRDLARVHGEPKSVGETLANAVPDPIHGRNVPMSKVVQDQPNLLKQWPAIVKDAIQLDGGVRHASMHACGIVISPEPISDHIPIYTSSKFKGVITQWPHEDIEDIGFVKFDLLSIDNLTIIDEALKLIKKRHNIDIDLETIPYDDIKTMATIGLGDTDGLFQVESDGMRGLLTQMKPKTMNDISDAIALYRPGPIGAGFIDQYLKTKFTGQLPPDMNSKLKPVLASTYYVPVYQEQIMQMAQILAGYTLSEADMLRNAIGKKKKKEMAKHEKKFQDGLKNCSSFTEAQASKLWHDLEGWVNYGFNKCLTPDTLVATINKGDIPLSDIIVGDTCVAVDTDGCTEPAKVMAIHINGLQDIYKIEFDDGSTECCTLEHKWITPRGTKTTQEIWDNGLHVWGHRLHEEGTSRLCKQAESIGSRQLKQASSAIAKDSLKAGCSCLRQLIRITKVGQQQALDLEIDHPSHSYLLSSGLATSNSHSYSYAVVTYQTAYLKTHYPLEFTCALLATRADGERERVQRYLKLARKKNINILGADINSSAKDFTIAKDQKNTVVFGLSALKGIGAKAAKEIIHSRGNNPFTGIEDFMSRIDRRIIDSRIFKSLAATGAFDGLGYDRRDVFAKAGNICQYYKDLDAYRKKLDAYNERLTEIQEYINTYGDIPGCRTVGKERTRPRIKKMPVKPKEVEVKKGTSQIPIAILNEEFKISGLYLSGHPGDLISIDEGSDSCVSDLQGLKYGAQRDMVVIFPTTEPIYDKKIVLIHAHDRDGASLVVSMEKHVHNTIKSDAGLVIVTSLIRVEKPFRNAAETRVRLIKPIVLYKSK